MAGVFSVKWTSNSLNSSLRELGGVRVAEHFNPWSPIGVSSYPPRFPMVGQEGLFRKLRSFVQVAAQTSFPENRVAGFFIVVGTWGMGKSRLGHELVAEATGQMEHWILADGQGRVFEPGLTDGNLPLMVKFEDVVDENLSRDNFLEHVALKVLDRFGHRPPPEDSNQGRAFRRTKAALQEKGVRWRNFQRALMDTAVSEKERLERVMDVLRQAGIERLFLIIDELESEQELVRDQSVGVQEVDRKSVRPIHLDMLPVIVKDNDYRQLHPDLNFILLCSRAIGDQVSVTGANVRRTDKVSLERGKFGDVTRYIDHVKRVVVADPKIRAGDLVANLQYPPGTVEAIYLATTGNLGWFNVVMNRIDSLFHDAEIEGQSLASHELLEDYALQDVNKYIFDRSVLRLIGRQHLDETEWQSLRRICYQGVPTPIDELRLPAADSLEKLLSCQVPDVGPALARLRLVTLTPEGVADTPEHVLVNRMVKAGFKAYEGSAYQYNACVIEPARLLEAFRTFSVGVGPGQFLIYEDLDSFRAQLITLYQQDGIEQGAEKLHAILMRSEYQVGDRTFVAPAWPLLTRLFRRAGAQESVQAFELADKDKARALEKRASGIDALEIKKRICLGLAQLFDRNRVQIQDPFDLESEYCIVLKATLQEFQVTEKGYLPILFYHTREHIINDLRRIHQKDLSPTILLFSDSPMRDEFLSGLRQTNPDFEVMLIPHVIDSASPERAFLLSYGFRDDGLFAHEDLTRESKGYYEDLLNTWRRKGETWRAIVEQQGYILCPIFNSPARVNVALFYRTYALLVAGHSYDKIIDPEILGFSKLETDDIKFAFKQVREVVLTKPTLPLLTKDNRWQFPPLLWRVLKLLKTEHEPLTLARRFFYPKKVKLRADTVVQQSLDLLCSLNLVERIERNQSYRYRRVSLESLSHRLRAVEDLLVVYEEDIGELAIFYSQAAIGLNRASIKTREHQVRDARKLVESLDLSHLDQEQADERAIARSVRTIRETFDKVAEICPLPLPNEPLLDLSCLGGYERDWERWTLWHKMWFLRAFKDKLTERRETVVLQIQKLHARLRETYGRVGDQVFPTPPLTTLLNEVEDDCDFLTVNPDKKRYTTLASSALKPEDNPSPFYVLMDGRRFAAMWSRLGFYERTLSDRDPASFWLHYKGCYDDWAAVRREHNGLREALSGLEIYFADSPAEVRGDFDDLQLEAEGVATLFEENGLADAVRDEGNSLGNLKEQVDQTRTRLAELLQTAQSLRPQAEEGLEKLKHEDRLPALNQASRRKVGKLAPVRAPRLSELSTYVGQQQALQGFNAAIETEAVKLLGSRENWEFYLQLVERAGTENRISVPKGELERLEQFARETDVIEIRMNPEVVL